MIQKKNNVLVISGGLRRSLYPGIQWYFSAVNASKTHSKQYSYPRKITLYSACIKQCSGGKFKDTSSFILN